MYAAATQMPPAEPQQFFKSLLPSAVLSCYQKNSTSNSLVFEYNGVCSTKSEEKGLWAALKESTIGSQQQDPVARLKLHLVSVSSVTQFVD